MYGVGCGGCLVCLMVIGGSGLLVMLLWGFLLGWLLFCR